MRRYKARVDASIARVIKKHGATKAAKMFAELMKLGGNRFRDVMRRANRIAKKKP